MKRKIYLDIRGNFGLGDFICMDPMLTKIQELYGGQVTFFLKFPAGNLGHRGDVYVLSSDDEITEHEFSETIKILGYKELGSTRYQQLERMESLIGHMCSYANLDCGEIRPRVYLTVDDFKKVPANISKESGYLALCTDFSDPRRHLPLGTWLEFIRGAYLSGFRIVLVGDKSLKSQVGIFQWARIKHMLTYDFQGKLSVRETAALISRCRIFAGNNSGLFHYAQAVDTDCLITMSVNNPNRYIHPGGPKVEYIISDHLPCIKCTEHSFEYIVKNGCVSNPKGLCMRELSAEMLMDKLKKITQTRE